MMQPALYKFFKLTGLPALLLCCLTAFAQTGTQLFDVNGLKVILKQTQKETLVMSMYYRGGLTNYSAADAGIESLAMQGVIDCGNGSFSANDFNEQQDEFGIHLTGDAANDYGVVKLRCISKYAEEGWKLFASAITSPAFDAHKFDMLKQEKTDEIRAGLSNPDARLRRLAAEFAFAGTPYANNPDGTVESITRLSRDAVKDYYYHTLLNKKRMFLVVAGPITKEALEKKVQSAFAEIPAMDYTPATVERLSLPADKHKIENRPLATNYVCGILAAPNLNSRDYPAYRIGISLLHSILFSELRLEKRLSYAPAAYITRCKTSYLTIYASTAKPQETVKAMYEVLSKVKGALFKDETVTNLQKNQLLGYMQRQEIMSDIADALGEAEIMGDWRLAENFDERVSTVTAAEIKRVLNDYLESISWAYIGDAALGEGAFER